MFNVFGNFWLFGDWIYGSNSLVIVWFCEF